MISAESDQWLELYGHYQNRILKVAGGIDDQPADYREAMALINAAYIMAIPKSPKK